MERLFAGFDATLREAGYLAMGGQIVDATVVQARRPRLSEDEKGTVKDGGVPDAWSKAKRAQMGIDGRWTIKRGRRRTAGEDEPQARVAAESAVPVFGYKDHLGIDRRHGRSGPAPPSTIRTFTVTDAAGHDGHQLGRLLDRDNTASSVWADTAYRSAGNVPLLARRGLVPQFQRPKPRGQPMPRNVRRGNATRARVRVAIEHVFVAQKRRFGLVVRSVGLARATTKLGLANLVTNMRRLVWFEPYRVSRRPRLLEGWPSRRTGQRSRIRRNCASAQCGWYANTRPSTRRWRRADDAAYVFYQQDTDAMTLDVSRLAGPQPAIAVDARKAYAETPLGTIAPGEWTWDAPYESDWAIAVGQFAARKSASETENSEKTDKTVSCVRRDS